MVDVSSGRSLAGKNQSESAQIGPSATEEETRPPSLFSSLRAFLPSFQEFAFSLAEATAPDEEDEEQEGYSPAGKQAKLAPLSRVLANNFLDIIDEYNDKEEEDAKRENRPSNAVGKTAFLLHMIDNIEHPKAGHGGAAGSDRRRRFRRPCRARLHHRQPPGRQAGGLIERRGSAADGRVREATISSQGKAMTDRVYQARQNMGRAIFASWDPADVENLVRLMRRFADDIDNAPVDPEDGQ
jgi:hypothetical protein